MAHVILGFLMIAPMSLYELVKAFESSVSLFYSASTGSIKRALDILHTEGRIEATDVQPGARGKKTYRLTDAGRRAFHDWMRSAPDGPDLETAALSRLFFLGLLAPEERAPVIERILDRIDGELAVLTAVEAQLNGMPVAEGHRELAPYQHATLDYGLTGLRAAREWFGALLERERSGGT
ncbi:PadR family transcriptional regulator [Microbacterium sp. JZ31]|uniref:PadR family transcriptional regulator n=1 Tax=Microbacterium sp. JZ31 TaxID=1906274 RepID=UPI0019314DE9|nr:PadR family transcriptional regulator [Microbacterium sp. JZ31]